MSKINKRKVRKNTKRKVRKNTNRKVRKNTNLKVRRNTNRIVRKNTNRIVRKTRRINKSGKIYRGGAIQFTPFVHNIFTGYFDIPNLVDYISSFKNDWYHIKIKKLYQLKCKLLLLKSDETKYRDFKSKFLSAIGGDPSIVNNTDKDSLAKVISVIITFNGSTSNESDILKIMYDCADSYCIKNDKFTPESTSSTHCNFEGFKGPLTGNYFIETIIKLFKINTDVLYRLAYLLTSLNNQNDNQCNHGPTSFNVDTLVPNQSVQGVDAEEVVTSSDTSTAEEDQTNDKYLVIFDNITEIQDMLNELKQLNDLNESDRTIIHEKLDSISTKLSELGKSGKKKINDLNLYIHMFKYNENLKGLWDTWKEATVALSTDPLNETLKTAADNAKKFYKEQVKARKEMIPGYADLRKEYKEEKKKLPMGVLKGQLDFGIITQERYDDEVKRRSEIETLLYEPPPYSLILDKINETIISAIQMIEQRLNLSQRKNYGGKQKQVGGLVHGAIIGILLLLLVIWSAWLVVRGTLEHGV